MTKSRLFLITTFILSFISIGKLLDWEAERVIAQLYQRDNHGVIQGLNGFHYSQDKPDAIILVHGFLDTPDIFKELFTSPQLRQDYDIFIPRLRFHARNLQSAKHFNNEAIKLRLLSEIYRISKLHHHVTIVAQSYAGALTLKLLSEHQLPKNSKLILLSPSFFIKENTLWGNFKLYSYGLWRNYCNYALLGCQLPPHTSGNRPPNPINLRYFVIPALKQLFMFDIQNRHLLVSCLDDFDVIIAKDDNRINYIKLKNACIQNSNCHLYTYPSGNHLLQQSAFKTILLKQLIVLSKA